MGDVVVGLKKQFELAVQGNQSAQAALIDLTQLSLFRFCLYLCGNRQLAEDICQDTYIKAFENLKYIQKADSFQSWLMKTAKNLFLDYKKSPKNKIKADIDDLAEELGQSENKEQILYIRECLGTLDEAERTILLLIDLEGMSYEEAAQVLDIKLENLKTKLHRARTAFIQRYNKS